MKHLLLLIAALALAASASLRAQTTNTIGFQNDNLSPITEVRITALSIDTSVSFNTLSGRRYAVEKTLDSLTWMAVSNGTNVYTNVVGNGGIISVLNRGSGCQTMSLYRARLVVP